MRIAVRLGGNAPLRQGDASESARRRADVVMSEPLFTVSGLDALPRPEVTRIVGAAYALVYLRSGRRRGPEG